MKSILSGFLQKLRKVLIKFLDLLIFRLYTTKFIFDKPKFDYQPIPWLGIHEAKTRGVATEHRWEEIQNHFNSSHKSMKDIGSCVGYFCISASEKFGIHTFGIEMNEMHLRLARRAVPDNLNNKCSFINMLVKPDNVATLPHTDITLLLSVWHHWVYHYGLEDATKMLQLVWSSTSKDLYFESGEEDTKEEFNLPFPSNTESSLWIKDYLQSNLAGSAIEILGKFEAGNYEHYSKKSFKRTLFKISK